MPIEFKEGVSPDGLGPEMWRALNEINELHQGHVSDGEQPLIVTSTTEGQHSVERSAHYRGDAADLRIWHYLNPGAFARAIEERLGRDYVVILEDTHIHVHWSPIYRGE